MIRTNDRLQGRRLAALRGYRLAALAACLGCAPALAATTPQSSSAAQPSLPSQPAGSPVVESLVGAPKPPLEVRRRPTHPMRHTRVGRARIGQPPVGLDRPALAGVELLYPLPRPGQPPHVTVPLPAYALDSVVTPYLTPAPPVVCHATPRDPDLPDPHLYRESTVACQPDNP